MTRTTTKSDHANPGALGALLSRYRFLYQTPGGRASPRVPHPGDVLYWLCGIGAMGALLFVTMR